MYRIFLFTFSALICSTIAISIEPSLNPGCKKCQSEGTILVYTKVINQENDFVIHLIWDFTAEVPTVFYIIGRLNSSLFIEWLDNIPTNVYTVSRPLYSFASILNNLIEYDDRLGSVFFNYSTRHRNISLKNIKWTLKDIKLSQDEVRVQAQGNLTNDMNGTNGAIIVTFQLLPFSGRMDTLPRLFHTLQSTLVDVSLVGLTTNPDYTSSRFALRYVFISEDGARENLDITVQKSIIDLYTPGVFEAFSLETPSSVQNRSGGFWQYLPVAYTAAHRGMSSSVEATVLTPNKTLMPNNRLVKQFYSEHKPQQLLVEEVVASFGSRDDGFYRQTNYTAWTHVIGFGAPSHDTMSLLPFTLAISVASLVSLVAMAAGVALGQRARRCLRVPRLPPPPLPPAARSL